VQAGTPSLSEFYLLHVNSLYQHITNDGNAEFHLLHQISGPSKLWPEDVDVVYRTHLDLDAQVSQIVSQADDIVESGSLQTSEGDGIFDVNFDAGRLYKAAVNGPQGVRVSSLHKRLFWHLMPKPLAKHKHLLHILPKAPHEKGKWRYIPVHLPWLSG
jgi:hypothetical protein